jgi:hypothetical protein
MAKDEQPRRIWRTSKLPSRPSSTTTSPKKKIKVKHEPTQDDHIAPDDQIPRHFVRQRTHGIIKYAPTTPPAHPHLPPEGVAQPSTSSSYKRESSVWAPIHAAIARLGNKNEVTFNSSIGDEYLPPAGDEITQAPEVGITRAFTEGEQAFTYEMTPSESGFFMREPLTVLVPAPLHPESSDKGDHDLQQALESDLDRRVSDTDCGACGSQRHFTKDCHVPSSKDGMVVICPFHDCSVRSPTAPTGHVLDTIMTSLPEHSPIALQHCDMAMKYKKAIRTQDRVRIRYMLPQMFGALVLGRKRKPCCRVVNPELCPINITIVFSREYCQGQMPAAMQGVWFYTRQDVKNPEIMDKLQRYDDLGWENMPPGELEAKSWLDIKHEYARGILLPQVHKVTSKKIQKQLAYMERLIAAEMRGEDVDNPGPAVEAARAEKKKKKYARAEEFQQLSEKVDSLVERLDALEARQDTGVTVASSAGGTCHTSNLLGPPIHWSVE